LKRDFFDFPHFCERRAFTVEIFHGSRLIILIRDQRFPGSTGSVSPWVEQYRGMDENKPKYLPLGAGLWHVDPKRDAVQVINDALAPRANFVRSYLENPNARYLDPVLRHHLGLTGLPEKGKK
jgi:hypothetical protein